MYAQYEKEMPRLKVGQGDAQIQFTEAFQALFLELCIYKIITFFVIYNNFVIFICNTLYITLYIHIVVRFR